MLPLGKIQGERVFHPMNRNDRQGLPSLLMGDTDRRESTRKVLVCEKAVTGLQVTATFGSKVLAGLAPEVSLSALGSEVRREVEASGKARTV